MKKIIIFLFTAITLASCQPVNHRTRKADDENRLDQLSWMLGKWQMQTPEGVITEEWSRPSDTQWQGISYMISAAGDTPFRENIRLNYSGDTLYYLPAVTNQNEGKEISFAEKSFSDSLIVFENLNHDFPQRIIYKRISDTSIMAAIEGTRNGKNQREEFSYVKTD